MQLRATMAVKLRSDWQWYDRANVFSELIGPIPRDAFHTKQFSDVQIVTCDGCVSAHKIVLAAVCPLLRRSLADGEDSATVIMPDFTTARVEAALRLFYGVASQDESDFEAVREVILATKCPRGAPAGKRKRGKRLHACPDAGCSFEASTAKALDAHSGVTHRAMSCALCNVQVKFEAFSQHLEDLHGQEEQTVAAPLTKSKSPPTPLPPFAANATGKYSCPLENCEAEETSLAAIRSHYRGHASAVCDACGKKVLRRNMKSHKAKHERQPAGGDERPRFCCKHCGSGYSDNHALRVHLRVKHDEGDLQFRCELCRSCFVRKPAFLAHVAKCRLRDAVKTRRCIKKPVDPNSEYSKFKVPVDPEKPAKCPEPDCDYEDARFLKRHYLDKHVSRKPLFLPAAKPTGLVEADSSSFFLATNEQRPNQPKQA